MMNRVFTTGVAFGLLSLTTLPAAAQDVMGGLNVFASNSQQQLTALTNGNVTQFFNHGEMASSGLVTALAAGTPAEPLAGMYASSSRQIYDGLVPLYQQLDGPAMGLAGMLPALPGAGTLPGLP